MYAILHLIDTVITIYIWLLIASVALSWLISFNVVNTGNRTVYEIYAFLQRITEPLLRPIRRSLPDMGGLDLSPLVLLLGLIFIQIVVLPNIAKLFV